jgi:hypothetical protein
MVSIDMATSDVVRATRAMNSMSERGFSVISMV